MHPQTRKYLFLLPDSVAQLVEHDTLNVGVLGSIPSRVTRVLQFVFHFMKDLVAQLVEHNTFNVGVLGSSPSQVTGYTICFYYFFKDLVAQLVEHNTFNVGVLGSSPSQVTYVCLRGEIGRLAILRGWCSLGRAGSNPVVGT